MQADTWNPSIAVNGSNLHVVWEDERQGNSEIYYKGSTDGGSNWGPDIRLTNDGANSWNPSVAVSGSVVHVAWYDDRDGNWEIYYKNSTDGGLTWGSDTRLTNNIAVSRYPCIAVSGSEVHLVWHDDRDGNYETYYKRSTDGGLTWGSDIRLTYSVLGAYYPSVAVSGSKVHVVWFDQRDGNYEIYYKRSLDAGINWDTDLRLTNDLAFSFAPSLAISGSVVHVVWQDIRDGNFEIYYKHDTNGNSVNINDITHNIEGIILFPNPANAVVNINYSGFNSGDQLSFINYLGQVISKQLITQQSFKLNTSNLVDGIYFIQIQSNRKSATKMLIVHH